MARYYRPQKSHLLAALLRAVNIPAGFCYQVLRLDPPINNELVLHGLNGIYLASVGRWIRLDARRNTRGVSAQFSLDKEQLAFTMESAAGEFIYDTIFAAPVSNVVNRLKEYNSRKELWLDVDRRRILTPIGVKVAPLAIYNLLISRSGVGQIGRRCRVNIARRFTRVIPEELRDGIITSYRVAEGRTPADFAERYRQLVERYEAEEVARAA